MNNHFIKAKVAIFLLLLVISHVSHGIEKPLIRLGVLAFGTVNWELDVLKSHQLENNLPFQLEIRYVASPQAGKIALQSGAVDIIVSDWIWVSRQRSVGVDLSFYPYSTTAGVLMVSATSNIKSLADLSQKQLGIAGGELDKNWLLLQALAQQNYQLDLNQQVTKVFAAPPLLNQQMLQGRVDAMINYWHYAVRLEAKGYHKLADSSLIQKQLGISTPIPTLGYVFNLTWAKQHSAGLEAFLAATKKSKDLICSSNQVWHQVIPLTKITDPNTLQLLRQRYCDGRIQHWGKQQQQDADKIYKILKNVSDNRLTGHSEAIQKGTFWGLD